MERGTNMLKIKWVFLVSYVILGLFISCFFAAPAIAGNNLLLGKIVENRDFFIGYQGNDINEGSLLCDVNNLGANRIGLLLLEPSGFLKSLVFNRESGMKAHEDMSIPDQALKNELMRIGIALPDARLIAKNIAGFSKGQANTIAPPNSIPRYSIYTDKALARFHEKISRQSAEIAAMDTGAIIRRFKTEIQEANNSK